MPGQIIVRQRGNNVLTGKNVTRGGDDTLYAAKAGVVRFKQTKKTGYDGTRRYAKMVSIVPATK